MQTNKMWIIKYAFHVRNFPHLKIIFMDLTVSLILLLLLLVLLLNGGIYKDTPTQKVTFVCYNIIICYFVR